MTREQIMEIFVERVGHALGSVLVDGISQKEVAEKLRELANRLDKQP